MAATPDLKQHYGGQAIFDHNLIWNVDRPIQMNRYSEDHPTPIGSSDDGPMGEIWVYNNTVIADSWNKPGIQNNHVNESGEGMHYKNNIISNKINATLELAETDSNLYIQKSDVEDLFVDYENFNFQLNSSATQAIDKGIDASPYNDTIINDVPDIGAFEYGAEPWTAGPEGVITNIKITEDVVRVIQKDTVQFSATAFTSGFIQMDPQPKFYWYADGSGHIDQNGLYIADSVDTDARVYVTTDSLLWAHTEFKVYQLQTGIDNQAIQPQKNNFRKLKFNIYPVPANNQVNISLDKATVKSADVLIKVFDAMGRECEIVQIDLVNHNEITLHTSSLERGIYVVQIFSADAFGTGKIIID